MPNSKAAQIQKEILETEKAFIENLTNLVKIKNYIDSLQASKKWKNFTSKEKAAFTSLRDNLEACRKVAQSGREFSEAFIQDKGDLSPRTIDYFRHHLDNINHASILYTDYSKLASFVPKKVNKEVTKILKNVPEGKARVLDAILIMPVQRTPRYQLLFKDLTKHATGPLKESAEKCSRLAIYKVSTLNEDMRLYSMLKDTHTAEDWRILFHKVTINVTKGIHADLAAIQFALDEQKRKASLVKNKKGVFGHLRTEAKEAREFLEEYSKFQAGLVELLRLAVKNGKEGYFMGIVPSQEKGVPETSPTVTAWQRTQVSQKTAVAGSRPLLTLSERATPSAVEQNARPARPARKAPVTPPLSLQPVLGTLPPPVLMRRPK